MAKSGIAIQKGTSQKDGKVSSGLAVITDSINDQIKAIALKAGQKVIEKTDPHVPVDTGALVQSSRVTIRAEKNLGITSTVSYGGPTRAGATRNAPTGNVDYAGLVHEDANHRGFKYLQKGRDESLEDVKAILLEGLRNLKV